jgi:hypothetical protein
MLLRLSISEVCSNSVKYMFYTQSEYSHVLLVICFKSSKFLLSSPHIAILSFLIAKDPGVIQGLLSWPSSPCSHVLKCVKAAKPWQLDVWCKIFCLAVSGQPAMMKLFCHNPHQLCRSWKNDHNNPILSC